MASTGAWVTYGGDGSPALLSSEIQAWRYAGARGQKVAPWRFGQTLEATIAAAEAENERVLNGER